MARHFKVLVLLAKILASVLLLVVSENQPCPDRRFVGPRCNILCNCNDTAECSNAENCTCKNRYFGYYCQYVDVEDDDSDNDKGNVARDSDFNTCFTSGSQETNLTIHFTYSSITFIHIRYHPSVTPVSKSLELELWLKAKETEYRRCNEVKFYRANSVELYCFESVNADTITISGSGVEKACEVYISQGRNLAIKAVVTVNITNSLPENGIDGDTATEYRSESHEYETFNITFQNPVVLTKIVIQLTDADGFTLRHANETSETFPRKADVTDRLIHVFYEPFPVKGVDVFGVKGLRIGELETFGDCIWGFYSFDCSEPCAKDCLDTRCSIDGECLNCQPGFYGLTCDGECGNCAGTGKCNLFTGYCDEGCKPGFMDNDCRQKCGNCAGAGQCNITTGYCDEGCTPWFMSYDCRQKCGNCAGAGKCDISTGFCDEGCKPGYMGYDCRQRCGNCAGAGKCNISTGYCDEDCNPGYMGYDCRRRCGYCSGAGDCNILTGQCDQGCRPGYMAFDCRQKCVGSCGGSGRCHQYTSNCQSGCRQYYHGLNCTEECSGNCGGSGRCNDRTGKCNEGCLGFFIGDTCNERLYICSDVCAGNGTCDANTKTCLDGCKPGLFGLNCTRPVKCSPFCGGTGSCFEVTQECRSGCQLGYFRRSCTTTGLLSAEDSWTCHCPDEICSKTMPTCQSNKCPRGWFGPYCYHRDLAVYTQMSAPELVDNDDLTCSSKAVNNISTIWSDKITVSWFRLVFQAPVEKHLEESFNITYQSNGTQYNCVGLTAMRVPQSSNKALDVPCHVFYDINEVLIEWIVPRTLCSIYIFEGRNVAEVSEPYLTNKYDKSFRTLPFLIDGDVSTQKCTYMNVGHNDTLNWVTKGNFEIFRLNLYTVPRYINTTVHVQFETKRRNVYFANNFNWNNTLFKFSITFSDVKYISIFKLEVTEGMLQLCEIELIGDCVSGFFGYLCEGICSLTCANQMCDNYGRCIQCVQGRKGPYCQDVEIIEVIVNTTLTTPLAGQAEGDKFHHSEEIFLLIVFITIPIVACFLCYGLLTVYTERTSSLYNVEF